MSWSSMVMGSKVPGRIWAGTWNGFHLWECVTSPQTHVEGWRNLMCTSRRINLGWKKAWLELHGAMTVWDCTRLYTTISSKITSGWKSRLGLKWAVSKQRIKEWSLPTGPGFWTLFFEPNWLHAWPIRAVLCLGCLTCAWPCNKSSCAVGGIGWHWRGARQGCWGSSVTVCTLL